MLPSRNSSSMPLRRLLMHTRAASSLDAADDRKRPASSVCCNEGERIMHVEPEAKQTGTHVQSGRCPEELRVGVGAPALFARPLGRLLLLLDQVQVSRRDLLKGALVGEVGVGGRVDLEAAAQWSVPGDEHPALVGSGERGPQLETFALITPRPISTLRLQISLVSSHEIPFVVPGWHARRQSSPAASQL